MEFYPFHFQQCLYKLLTEILKGHCAISLTDQSNSYVYFQAWQSDMLENHDMTTELKRSMWLLFCSCAFPPTYNLDPHTVSLQNLPRTALPAHSTWNGFECLTCWYHCLVAVKKTLAFYLQPLKTRRYQFSKD